MATASSSSLLSTASSVAGLFFRRHLFATNIALSFSLSGLGDFLQQKYERYESKQTTKAPFKWNTGRSLHMSATYGLTSGVLCHYWYNILDRFVPGKGIRVVVRKILFDQVLFSPICIGSCLAVDCVIEGQRGKELLQEVTTKGYYLYVADWIMWPPAQFVNFYFLPTRFRVLFDNLVSLGVDVYTSHVKHRIPSPKETAFSEKYLKESNNNNNNNSNNNKNNEEDKDCKS